MVAKFNVPLPPEAVDRQLDFESPSPGLSSLLVPQYTSVQSSSAISYRQFLISGMRKQVEWAEGVYLLIDRFKETNRLKAFQECRSSAWFVRHRETHEVRVASKRCNLRWCPICIKVKRYIITQSVAQWCRSLEKPKFLTLTLRHSSIHLSDQIDRLYKCFRALKLRKSFRHKVRGGIWFFQVKRSDSTGAWHPHLHCLIDSAYFSQKYLSELWLSVTKDSSIVDIRPVKDEYEASEYVARYASAPCDLSKLDRPDSMEAVLSLENRRILGKWGTASDVPLTPKKQEDWYEWEDLFSFSFVCKGHNEDVILSEIWRCWRSGDRCNIDPAFFSGREPPAIEAQFAEPERCLQSVFSWMDTGK